MADIVTRRGIELAGVSGLQEGRMTPSAVDIEEQILGAMLLEKEAISKVIEVLDEDTFHAERHRKIFQAIGLRCSSGASRRTLLRLPRNSGVAASSRPWEERRCSWSSR